MAACRVVVDLEVGRLPFQITGIPEQHRVERGAFGLAVHLEQIVNDRPLIHEPVHPLKTARCFLRTVFAFNAKAYREFLARLDAPPRPNKRLRKSLQTPAPWE
jgi:hypothetical protein